MKQNLLRHMVVLVLAMIANTGLLWADGYVEVVHDTIVKNDTVLKVDTIYQNDTIETRDTCLVMTVPPTKTAWQRFTSEWITPTFTNIIAALIFLFITYLVFKPKMEIEPIAIQMLNNRACFIVRNKSCWAKLYSVKAELEYIIYDKEHADYRTAPIDLDIDSSLSVIANDRSKKTYFYVFHTKEAFIRDRQFREVRLRISATNSISNIFSPKEQIFRYTSLDSNNKQTNDILWGAVRADQFVPISEMYNVEEQARAQQIIEFNEKVTRIFLPYGRRSLFLSEAESRVWEEAKAQLQSLTTRRTLYNNFKLRDIAPIVNKINKDFDTLYGYNNENVVITNENRDKREKLFHEMKRDLVIITRYIQENI